MKRLADPTFLVLLVGVAFVLADATLIWIGFQSDFAFDFTCCYQQAAARVLDAPGTLYDWSSTYTFRYTPLGALPFLPLVPFDESTAAWIWLGFKALLLIVAALWFSAPWTGSRRWLVVLLVVAFPPIVHDLMIGNVSTITLLVLLAVARWRDWRGGLVLGVLTVLMPKPHLVPILAYVAIRRPRDFMATAATVAAGVLIGLVVFGFGPWVDFIGTLREPLERTFTANVGFSGLLGPVGVGIGLLIAFVIFAVGMHVGGARGYGLSIIAGIAMGPYTFIHYLSGTLIAAEPVLRTRPRRLAPFPWLLVVFPLIPLWLVLMAWAVRSTPPLTSEEAAPPPGGPS